MHDTDLAVFDDRTGCIVRTDPNLLPYFSDILDILHRGQGMISKLKNQCVVILGRKEGTFLVGSYAWLLQIQATLIDRGAVLQSSDLGVYAKVLPGAKRQVLHGFLKLRQVVILAVFFRVRRDARWKGDAT